MASPLTIDKEEVRATYLATGNLKETARLHGMKYTTVRKWANRYHWETATNAEKLRRKADAIVEIKRENAHKDVTPVTRSSDALALALNSHASTFRTNMASSLARSSEALAEMDGFTALDNSRRMVDLATAAGKIFPDMADESGRLQVNILGLGAEALWAGVSQPSH